MIDSNRPNNTDSGPHFIVFEGLDGSGKSTSAKLLAEKLDAVFLTTPSPDMRAYRDRVIADLGPTQEAHQLFYLATVFAASTKVAALLAEGHSVVLDRYFLSTQAYAKFRGSTLGLDEISDQLLPADMTIYMDLPVKIRRTRLSQRVTTAADSETLSDEADACLRANHLDRFGLSVVGRLVRIDGESLASEQVVSLVLDAVKEM